MPRNLYNIVQSSRWQKRPLLAIFLILAFTATGLCAPEMPELPSVFAPFGEEKVHYKRTGEEKTAVVFIHGWSCDHTVWRYQVAALKGAFEAVLVDLPGHGKSSAPKIDYTPEHFAASVLAVMEHAGLTKAVLVGHSMGYSVAREFARQYPGKALGICIVDGFYLEIPEEPAARKQWRIGVDAFLAGITGDNREEFLKPFIDSLFVPSSPEGLKAEISEMVMRTPPRVANSAMKEIFEPGVWTKFSATVPVLAIYAESPDIPKDIRSHLKSRYKRLSFYQWADVGHFLMMEKPDLFNRIFLGFLIDHFR